MTEFRAARADLDVDDGDEPNDRAVGSRRKAGRAINPEMGLARPR